MAKNESKKIEKAVRNYEVLTGDAEVKRLAEIRLMSELEEKSALASARAIGREKGEKIGREKGEKIGRAKGEAIGEAREKKKIAKGLLKLEIPIKQIMKATELTEEEIRKIQEDEK